ncbi:NAD(P)-dependent oxidoreductase [Capillimicrobium parvum]|uniref:2-(Hydroxymethyl)glutarate dehydrogenase n=1 Tax=Capillimicrobium parvum TaxID=2884022 RepID=A0A9E7BZP4_9ACTN|nr:NAD(P)-dependent oxidoreductase [Capillimicrobium parvum]UGS35536.1 2-(hydroxymethyl)glutarate dehydrogenase [Capillimicrobium parvum]
MSNELPRIGVVGLGNMGGRIAARIRETGRSLIGFDADPAQAARHGIEAAGSLRELVEQADVILLSLPDSRVVEAVMRGPEGLIAAAREGQVVVDLSTASPSSTRALATELAARGATLLDAGVSGGAAAAEKGTLAIMVGGDPGTLEQVREVLERFSTSIFHMGDSGAGHVTKLLNNFLNAVSLAATAEVMVAARVAELDLHKVLDVINASSGVNFASLKRFPNIVDGDYMEGGLTSKLMLKDVTLYLDMLRELGAPSLNAAGPVASFGLALGQGYGDEISNRVVDAIGDVAGGVRLHEEA